MRALIKDALVRCDTRRLDWVLLRLVVGGEDAKRIESVMRQELAKLSHEHQTWWLEGQCYCHETAAMN